MKTEVTRVEFSDTQQTPFQSAQWHPLPFIMTAMVFAFLAFAFNKGLGEKMMNAIPILRIMQQTTTAVTGPITHNTATQSVAQIEEERAPMPEPQIRKISADNNAVATSITITKAGQSLCNFVSLRDALRIAMKYKLPTYGEDSKEVVTSVAHGLALAKREKVVTIVTKGQEFLLE